MEKEDSKIIGMDLPIKGTNQTVAGKGSFISYGYRHIIILNQNLVYKREYKKPPKNGTSPHCALRAVMPILLASDLPVAAFPSPWSFCMIFRTKFDTSYKDFQFRKKTFFFSGFMV
jgi:hypothetical protein